MSSPIARAPSRLSSRRRLHYVDSSIQRSLLLDQLVNARVQPYVDEHYWVPLYSVGAFATPREAHPRKDVSGTACENCIAYSPINSDPLTSRVPPKEPSPTGC